MWVFELHWLASARLGGPQYLQPGRILENREPNQTFLSVDKPKNQDSNYIEASMLEPAIGTTASTTCFYVT